MDLRCDIHGRFGGRGALAKSRTLQLLSGQLGGLGMSSRPSGDPLAMSSAFGSNGFSI